MPGPNRWDHVQPQKGSNLLLAATGAQTAVPITGDKKVFGLQVLKTGAVTSWTVTLEGGLDGTNFTTLLTHTDVTPGDTKLIWNAAGVLTPVTNVRVNVTALVLGGGTSISVRWIGA